MSMPYDSWTTQEIMEELIALMRRVRYLEELTKELRPQ